MNKGCIYYIILNRIKDRAFLFFYLLLIIFAAYTVYKPWDFTLGQEYFDALLKQMIMYSVFFPLIMGINGFGKDWERGYLELILSKPVKIGELVISYYIVSFLFSILPFVFILWPKIIYIGHHYNFSLYFILTQLTLILLILSYISLFTVLVKGNMYIVIFFLFLVLNITTKEIAILNKFFHLLFPRDNSLKIIISIIVFIISLLIVNYKFGEKRLGSVWKK